MKRESYIIFIAAASLLAGCQRNEDYNDRQANNYLDVSIQGITSSNWGTKTRTTTESSDTLWLNDSLYVEAVIDDIATEQAPTTRATPVTDAKQITELSIVMFNTNTSKWSTSSVQESGKSPILARNTNGSYIISNPYTWLEEDPNYRTLIAMSPRHTTDEFALSNSGQSLDVTVPNDVTKQYDLCVSDISLNKDIQYTIGSNSNQQQFEMTHVMTAVGFDAAGYDLMLTGVKFIGVNSKNTLTLHNRTWGTSDTPINFEAKIKSEWLNSEHIQTSNPWRNITPNDGYLMMLPQTHTDDMKLEFTFTGQNGQPGGTYTMLLKDIKADGAATSDWKQGVKITYRLRLKTRPAVQVSNIAIADHTAGSTTPVLNIITSTDDDLTFSWTASWLGMYRGTNSTITNPESNGFFTPFATGVNNWANVKFFARNENKSTIADRTATITVWGKKSGVRTFTVTHKMKRLDGVKIGNLYWAKGNLVADGSNGCKIGAPSDYGLFFNFGSLVGWGNGTGQEGQVDRFASQRVTPAGYSGTTSYPAAYYTGGSPLTDVASTGIGDPCRYYLKGSWRTPTTEEQIALLAAGKGKWATNGGTNGMWFGINPGTVSSSVFFPASGTRGSYGLLSSESEYGAYWSSSVYNTNGYYMSFNVRGFQSQAYIRGNYSCSVRCVSTAP